MAENPSLELANWGVPVPSSRGDRSECSRRRGVERLNSLREIFLEYRRHHLLQPERVGDPSALTLDRRKSGLRRLMS